MTTATSQDKEKKKATKTQPKERPSRDPSDFQTPVAPAFPNFFLLPPLFLRLSRWRNPTVTIRPGFLRALMSRWHTDRTDSPDNPHAHQNHRIVLNASPPTHTHPSNHAGHVQGLRNLASSCCFSIAPHWTNLRIYLFFWADVAWLIPTAFHATDVIIAISIWQYITFSPRVTALPFKQQYFVLPIKSDLPLNF